MSETKGSAGVLRAVHIALVISDLDRSLRFYCDGLGFQEVGRIKAEGPGAAAVGGIEGDAKFEGVVINREAVSIELVHLPSPGVLKRTDAMKPNEIGYKHLGVLVEDLDKAIAALAELGGTVLEKTRTRMDVAEVVMTLDPDGNRVELNRLFRAPFKFPGE